MRDGLSRRKIVREGTMLNGMREGEPALWSDKTYEKEGTLWGKGEVAKIKKEGRLQVKNKKYLLPGKLKLSEHERLNNFLYCG